MLKFAVLLAFIVASAAADAPTFVGKFKLEVDSQKSNYERIFKAVGFKSADIKKFLGLVSNLAVEIGLFKNQLTCIFSSGSTSVSNTFELGVRKTAKLLVGGTGQVIVFQQSDSRLAVHTTYGKGELNTVMDCDEEACSIIYSAKGANLVTKWRRETDDGGDGGGDDGGD